MRFPRGLIGPGIMLALACVLAAAIGASLASSSGNDSLTAATARTATNPASTPRPTVSGVAAYEIVDGPALATQVVATVQAKELLTGRSAGLDQRAPPGSAEICVHDASGQAFRPDEMAAQVAFALNEAYANAGQTPPHKSAPPRIATPCPADPPLLAAGAAGVNGDIIVGLPLPNVEYASQFRVFLYIVPDEVIQRHFPGPRTNAPGIVQERRMLGKIGEIFSTGHYLTPNEFRSTEFLRGVLNSGLHIDVLRPSAGPGSYDPWQGGAPQEAQPSPWRTPAPTTLPAR